MVSFCRKAVKWTTRAFSQCDSIWLVWKRISVLYFAPTTQTKLNFVKLTRVHSKTLVWKRAQNIIRMSYSI